MRADPCSGAPTRTCFPGFGEGAPLDVPDLGDPAGLLARFRDGSMGAFTETMAAVHHCAHPVRLKGSSITVDPATGEALDTFSSDELPLGLLYRACGNRRVHV